MTTLDVFETITSGGPEDLRALLAASPELARSRNDAGVSALLFTLYQRKPEMTAVLVETAVPQDVFEASALGNLDRLRDLVSERPDCVHGAASDGFTPLHLACFFSTGETVEFLLGLGADVNVPSGEPMNLRPLHSAAAVGNLDSCRLLLERGANPNHAQQGGWTPLHSAAMHGNLQLAELLLEFGASATQAADVGKNALDLARDGGHAELEALLTTE